MSFFTNQGHEANKTTQLRDYTCRVVKLAEVIKPLSEGEKIADYYDFDCEIYESGINKVLAAKQRSTGSEVQSVVFC